MAQQLPIEGHFGYRNLHLVKSEDNSLGIGSYGAVYKARCDQLPCAAKVLHPILFSTRDPASRRIVERFEQECQFLSGMRHPNIIQYLGTCRDPESGLPVLLMELMDYSLTSFLERPDDPPPLPFHIQVNISLDVAQALAYLHSNEVLHRDLSSNNVLLIGSSRAKVTDFGMARAAGPNPRLTVTFCPGTMGYMSPESLQEPPAYTTKLDIFSCGVLHIQIITRKFPDPGPRMQAVEVGNDPRFVRSRVHMEVPELERRRSHIDLIDPTHPLLRIALDCLKDKEGERPSAEQLCSSLAALKEAPRYQESLRQAQQAAQSLHEGTEAQPEPQRELLQQNQELRQQLEEREETVQAKEREVDGLVRSMEQLRLQSERHAEEKDTQIQQRDIEICQKDEQVQQLRRQLHQTSRDSEQLVAALQHSLEQKDEVIRSKDKALRSKDEVIRSKDAALQEKERQIRELRQSQGDKRGSSTAAQPLRLQWRSGPKAPLVTFGESSAVQGRVAYFYSWDENKIMMYNSGTGKWAILPECPKREFSIAVVNSLLTAIGGRQLPGDKATKTLLSLTEQQEWTEQFPPMTYYHIAPAVACTSTSLIVAGGGGPDKEWAPVEVMDTSTLCWSTAASLPHPWWQATAIIIGDRMYMAGGFVKDVHTNSVLTCVVSELLQSTATQHQSLGARPTAASGLQPSTDSHKVWQEAAPLPVYRSSLASFHGRLLAVGGCDSASNPTSAVYQYDTATNSWKVISHMSTKRIQCFTAVLPDNTLLVAGGYVRTLLGFVSTHTDSVEIASCM